jgi:hypothetical protein
MGFNFPRQIKRDAFSLRVVGPNHRLFLKFLSHFARIYSQCNLPCPAGRDDPVITGHDAASGMRNIPYLEIGGSPVDQLKTVRQLLTLKNGGKRVCGLIQMDHGPMLGLLCK